MSTNSFFRNQEERIQHAQYKSKFPKLETAKKIFIDAGKIIPGVLVGSVIAMDVAKTGGMVYDTMALGATYLPVMLGTEAMFNRVKHSDPLGIPSSYAKMCTNICVSTIAGSAFGNALGMVSNLSVNIAGKISPEIGQAMTQFPHLTAIGIVGASGFVVGKLDEYGKLDGVKNFINDKVNKVRSLVLGVPTEKELTKDKALDKS